MILGGVDPYGPVVFHVGLGYTDPSSKPVHVADGQGGGLSPTKACGSHELMMYIMEVWHELESERLGRSYLHEEGEVRALFPPVWLKKHSPYWPKVTRSVS